MVRLAYILMAMTGRICCWIGYGMSGGNTLDLGTSTGRLLGRKEGKLGEIGQGERVINRSL